MLNPVVRDDAVGSTALAQLITAGQGTARIKAGAEGLVARWVKLCGVAEAPEAGKVMECEVEGVGVCLANVDGELSALDNWCPHRRGPLGQGWIEGDAVVCPWHSWTFHVKTGAAEYPAGEKVEVFPLRVEDGDVLVDIE